jgi:hypothetical protein
MTWVSALSVGAIADKTNKKIKMSEMEKSTGSLRYHLRHILLHLLTHWGRGI